METGLGAGRGRTEVRSGGFGRRGRFWWMGLRGVMEEEEEEEEEATLVFQTWLWYN